MHFLRGTCQTVAESAGESSWSRHLLFPRQVCAHFSFRAWQLRRHKHLRRNALSFFSKFPFPHASPVPPFFPRSLADLAGCGTASLHRQRRRGAAVARSRGGDGRADGLVDGQVIGAAADSCGLFDVGSRFCRGVFPCVYCCCCAFCLLRVCISV
jgi:hypothetical protein